MKNKNDNNRLIVYENGVFKKTAKDSEHRLQVVVTILFAVLAISSLIFGFIFDLNILVTLGIVLCTVLFNEVGKYILSGYEVRRKNKTERNKIVSELSNRISMFIIYVNKGITFTDSLSKDLATLRDYLKENLTNYRPIFSDDIIESLLYIVKYASPSYYISTEPILEKINFLDSVLNNGKSRNIKQRV